MDWMTDHRRQGWKRRGSRRKTLGAWASCYSRSLLRLKKRARAAHKHSAPWTLQAISRKLKLDLTTGSRRVQNRQLKGLGLQGYCRKVMHKEQPCKLSQVTDRIEKEQCPMYNDTTTTKIELRLFLSKYGHLQGKFECVTFCRTISCGTTSCGSFS